MRTFYRPPGGFRGRGPRHQPPPDAHRINSRITAREVRVIAENGDQLGVMSSRDALNIAEEAGLDLVEVAPNANPPVCRVMDYGKFKYKEQKKEAEARKNRAENTVKELRIRYRTDSGDLAIKLGKAREFLLEGDKVKFSMRFRGREAMFLQLGHEKLSEIARQLSDIATIDDRSQLGGNQLYITFAPIKQQGAKKGAPAPQQKS